MGRLERSAKRTATKSAKSPSSVDQLAEKRARATAALAATPAAKPAAPLSADALPPGAKRIPIQKDQASEFLRLESEIGAATARIMMLRESQEMLARFALVGAGLNAKGFAIVGIDGLESASQELLAIPIEQVDAYKQRVMEMAEQALHGPAATPR